jgi:hypothetical protein
MGKKMKKATLLFALALLLGACQAAPPTRAPFSVSATAPREISARVLRQVTVAPGDSILGYCEGGDCVPATTTPGWFAFAAPSATPSATPSQTPTLTPPPTNTATATATQTPTRTATPGASWTFCANENSYCAFTGTRQVRYGALNVYNYGMFTNGVLCANSVFGDPLVGAEKQCWYGELAATVTPPPTVAANPTPYQYFLAWISRANPPPTSLAELEQLPYLSIAAVDASGAPLNGVRADVEVCDIEGAGVCPAYHSVGSIVTAPSTLFGETRNGIASTGMPAGMWYRVSISGTVISTAYWMTETLYSGISVRVGSSGVTALGAEPKAAKDATGNLIELGAFVVIAVLFAAILRSVTR